MRRGFLKFNIDKWHPIKNMWPITDLVVHYSKQECSFMDSKANVWLCCCRGASTVEMAPAEIFQLLSRMTQVFRDEYMLKHLQVMGELEKR